MAVGRLSGLSRSMLSFLQEEGPDHAFPTAGATATATSFLMEAEHCLEMEPPLSVAVALSSHCVAC